MAKFHDLAFALQKYHNNCEKGYETSISFRGSMEPFLDSVPGLATIGEGMFLKGPTNLITFSTGVLNLVRQYLRRLLLCCTCVSDNSIYPYPYIVNKLINIFLIVSSLSFSPGYVPLTLHLTLLGSPSTSSSGLFFLDIVRHSLI